jgi:hypothetical protein
VGSMLQLSDETVFTPLVEGSRELQELAALADEGSLAYVKRMGITAWDQFKKNPVPKLVSFALGALGVTELRKLFGSGHALLAGDGGVFKLRKALAVVAAVPIYRKLVTIRDELERAAKSSAAIGNEVVRSTSAGILRRGRSHTITELIRRFDVELVKLNTALQQWRADRNNDLVRVDATPLTPRQKAIGSSEDVRDESGKAKRGAAPSERAAMAPRARTGAVSSAAPPPGSELPPVPPAPTGEQYDPDKARADAMRVQKEASDRRGRRQ